VYLCARFGENGSRYKPEAHWELSILNLFKLMICNYLSVITDCPFGGLCPKGRRWFETMITVPSWPSASRLKFLAGFFSESGFVGYEKFIDKTGRSSSKN
jgi:hypothetical protein